MRHDEKYLLINQAFQGKQRLMPFFNRQNNDDLILAIQAAGVTRGRNGFHKDKGGEKLAESEEDLLEHRTEGTDAFDTLFLDALAPRRDCSRGASDVKNSPKVSTLEEWLIWEELSKQTSFSHSEEIHRCSYRQLRYCLGRCL